MTPITVAIADADVQRRLKLEQLLQANREIKVLTNAESSGMGVTRNRRRSSRLDVSVVQNLVARTRRLAPEVLLVNLNHCVEEDGSMLSTLKQECPRTKVVVLADDANQHEAQIMQALARGARGYLDFELDPIMVGKALRTVNDGGAWIPRRMLGSIIDQLSAWKRVPTE